MERIAVIPELLGGRPTIRAMRIRVQDVLEMLAAGMSESQILDDFPDLETADIQASLAYAARELDRPVRIG